MAERHDHTEWLGFLKHIDRQTPKGLQLHLIADNYGTHKHPEVAYFRPQNRNAVVDTAE